MNCDSHGRVLIIDDEWAIQRALEARLTASGFTVQLVSSGQAGLDAVAEGLASGNPPDAILLDLRMPEMDGFEVLRRLRSSPLTAVIPVIFLTANVQDTVKQQAVHAGAAGFLTKPYEPGVVVAAILRVTAKAA